MRRLLIGPFAYLAALARATRDGWNRFVFTPADPTALGLVRVVAGALAFWSLFVYGLDLPAYLPRHVVLEVARLVFQVWVDGRVLPRRAFQLDPWDEGVLFGRGVWESTRTVDGVPWLWTLHVERLLRTAALLGIDLDPARIPAEEQVRDFVRAMTTMDVVVRLNVTAGRVGRPGVVWMTATLPPAPISALRLRSTRYPFEKGHPYLTWKTFQYASRLQLGRDAAHAGFDSALLVDDAGMVLESAHANVFFRFDDGWATPEADGGLLPGTTRRHLLDHAPRPIVERKIALAELASAREAFATNSNVGIVPVTGVDQHTFRVGAETMELARWLEADRG